MSNGIFISESINTKDVQHYGHLYFDVENKTDDCHITTFSRSIRNGAWTDWYQNLEGHLGARAGTALQILINITYMGESMLQISNLSFDYYNNRYQTIRIKAGKESIISFNIAMEGKHKKIRARSITNDKTSQWTINEMQETVKDVYDKKNTQMGFQISTKPDTPIIDFRKGLSKET